MVRPTMLKDAKVVNLYLESEQIKKVRESGMSISAFIRKLLDEHMGKLNLYKELELLQKENNYLRKRIPKPKPRVIRKI
jgi:hypothetical protein